MTTPPPDHRQHRSRPAARRTLALPALAAAAAAVSLAACGSVQAGRASSASRPHTATRSRPATTPPSTPASTSAAPPSPASSTSAATVAACTSAGVRVTLDTSASGVAAGSSFVPLQFANDSGQSCELAGYPDVSFQAGAAGRTIGAGATPDRSVLASSVVLAPGGIAHAWLQVADTVNFPATKCDPVTADGLRVGLPGAASATYLAHRFPACAATMSGTQILTIQPVQPGAAQRGSAQ